MIAPDELKKLAKSREAENKKFFARLKQRKPANLDETVSNLHEEAFEHIDCLKCANCCKTTSPIFYIKDIERLAKHFKIKANDFIARYLHIDEDGDYVLNTAPCPFLDAENYCMVYENRPNACREYPHTNARKFHRLFNITLNNTAVCPAVYEIVEKLKEVYS